MVYNSNQPIGPSHRERLDQLLAQPNLWRADMSEAQWIAWRLGLRLLRARRYLDDWQAGWHIIDEDQQ